MLTSKVSHDCEVYGLFADRLPAAAQAQGEVLEWGRARQGLVPDFRIRLQKPEGYVDSLAELKVIGAGVSYYPRGVAGRGTDRRADGLSNLYKNKLRALDRRFHGTVQGETGPLEARLDSYGKLEGLVVGAWGEGSKDLHALIKVMAEARVLANSRSRGYVPGEGELSTVTGTIRRVLSCAFVRCHALCLLARLGQVGDGARGAAEC